MKNYNFILVVFITTVAVISCRKDFQFSPSQGNLTFSVDTLFLDTLFTNISSSTYTLKVYNNSNDDIFVPFVNLGFGEDSEYRLSIDGISGKTFENVEILAKDSLFIFVEVTIDEDAGTALSSYLYTDEIIFDMNENKQEVALVTLVKDVIFIHPDQDQTTRSFQTLTLNVGNLAEEEDITLQGRELKTSELHFTNEKSYVIYGYAVVPENETLIIDAGARIHFHNNSGLIVSNNASLQVNGSFSTDQELLDNEVIFEGDRLESQFSDTPGQWGSIWLLEGSIDNKINYATIKNASVAILADGNASSLNPKLELSNVQIYNASSYGVLGRQTSITAENLVINNCGQSSFAATKGGYYNVTHATIANYWDSSPRPLPALLIDNTDFDSDSNVIETQLEEANFNNCIIYGNNSQELLINTTDNNSSMLNVKFTNCLLRFAQSNPIQDSIYDFTNMSRYENMILNKNPDFKNSEENQFLIGESSEAINRGNTIFSNQVPLDILNINRADMPDLGAYQHIIFEE